MTSQKVINLQDYHADGWLRGEAVCLVCGDETETVIPTSSVQFMECDKCGCIKKVYKYPVQRGSVDWQCNCGNELFRINPQGVYCPMCGKWQEGF